MVLAVEVDRHAMVATDKSRIKGIINMPTAVPDPARLGGVKAVSEIGKQRPKQNVGTIIGRSIERSSAGKRTSIRTSLGLAKLNKEVENERATSKGQKDPKPEKGPTFVMKHKENSIKKSTSKPNEVWYYVDSGALNHRTSHEEWFSYLEKLEQPRVVETSDDIAHPIEHVVEY